MNLESAINVCKYRLRRGMAGSIFQTDKSDDFWLANPDLAAERPQMARRLAHAKAKWSLDQFVQLHDMAWWNDFQLGLDKEQTPDYKRLFILAKEVNRRLGLGEGHGAYDFIVDPVERALVVAMHTGEDWAHLHRLAKANYQIDLDVEKPEC